MLAETSIERVVDVRRFPGSRRNPQYSADAMALALPEMDIVYMPMPALGGRRRPVADSVNTAWRSEAFRGYADYMQTVGYVQAREQLAAMAGTQRVAVLCAEAVWWRCHRGLIADDFKARGWQVLHLLALGRVEPHPYTSAAHVVDGRLDYALPEADQPELF